MLVSCFTWLVPSCWAQTMMVSPDGLDDETRAILVSENSFYVAGLATYGPETHQIEGNSGAYYKLGGAGKLILAMATLRLAEKGDLKLDERIAITVPDILEQNPFRVAVTPRHLLTETAGFAVPPLVNDTLPLKRYAAHVRTAGQVAHHDPVGWGILISFLEQKAKRPLPMILQDEVLTPLGLASTALQIEGAHPILIQKNMSGTVALIAEVARILVRNQDKGGKRYLLPNAYEQLVNRHSWRMHPLGPSNTIGLSIKIASGQQWIQTLSVASGGVTIMAFPSVGISFVQLQGLPNHFATTVEALAKERFLPSTDAMMNDAKRLVEAFRPAGVYVPSDQPSLWLKNRLELIANHTVSLRDDENGTITLKRNGSKQGRVEHVYNRKAPFYYESPLGGSLTLSPFKQGGYMVIDNLLYHYAGVLGDPRFVIDLVPVFILLLFSTAYYYRSAITPVWRRMAAIAVSGTLFIIFGIACEYFFWPKAQFVWDMPWLITLWRIILNVGLALILSMPLFTLSFARQNKMPSGSIAILFVPLHLGMISIAAVSLFLVLVAWGIAGTF